MNGITPFAGFLMLLIVAIVSIASVIIYQLKQKTKPQLRDQNGKIVRIDPKTREALIEEYKRIKLKKSKFGAAKRKRIVDLVDFEISRGKIKSSEVEFLNQDPTR